MRRQGGGAIARPRLGAELVDRGIRVNVVEPRADRHADLRRMGMKAPDMRS